MKIEVSEKNGVYGTIAGSGGDAPATARLTKDRLEGRLPWGQISMGYTAYLSSTTKKEHYAGHLTDNKASIIDAFTDL